MLPFPRAKTFRSLRETGPGFITFGELEGVRASCLLDLTKGYFLGISSITYWANLFILKVGTSERETC